VAGFEGDANLARFFGPCRLGWELEYCFLVRAWFFFLHFKFRRRYFGDDSIFQTLLLRSAVRCRRSSTALAETTHAPFCLRASNLPVRTRL